MEGEPFAGVDFTDLSDPPSYPPPPDQPPAGFPPSSEEPRPDDVPAPASPRTAIPPPGNYPPPAAPAPRTYPEPDPPPYAYAPPAMVPVHYPAPLAAYPEPMYPGPPYGYAIARAPRGPSRRVWLAIVSGIVTLVLVLAAAGYGIGGYVFASNRISNAASAINAANSHRGLINGAFDTMGRQITSFDSSDESANKLTSAQIVSGSQTMASTVAADAQALRIARLRLNDLSWLTALSGSSLQDEAARIEHARKAIADVNSAATDYEHLGQFLQVFWQVEIDLRALFTAFGKNDGTGSLNAFTSLRADIPNALQLAGARSVPAEYHDFLVAIQAYATDLRQESIASSTGDQKALAAAQKAAVADFDKAAAIDFAGTGVVIRSYYQRYRDDFNSELDLATA